MISRFKEALFRGGNRVNRWWNAQDMDEKWVVVAVFFGYMAVFGLLAALTLAHQKSPVDLLIVTPKDATEYAMIAKNMVEHGRFTFFGTALPEVFRTPVYPAFLAVIFAVARTWYVVPLVQSLIVACTAILVLRFSKRFLPRWLALAVAALFALDPMMMLGAFTTLTDVLYVAVMVWVIDRLVGRVQQGAQETGSRPWFFVSIGAALACAALLRPIGLPLLGIALVGIPLFWRLEGLVSWRGACRVGLILACSMACVVAPWYLRNRVVTGEWVFSTVSAYNMIAYNIAEYVSTQERISLEEARARLFAQAPDLRTAEDYRGVQVLPAYATIQRSFFARAFRPYVVFHARESMTLFVASGWNVAKSVVDRITDAPRATTYNRGQLVAQRAWGSLARSLVSSPYELLFAFERVVYGLIALLAMFAPLLGERKHRYTFVAMLGFVWYVVAATGPVAMARYRLPIWPFLLVLAGVSVLWVFKRIRSSS